MKFWHTVDVYKRQVIIIIVTVNRVSMRIDYAETTDTLNLYACEVCNGTKRTVHITKLFGVDASGLNNYTRTYTLYVGSRKKSSAQRFCLHENKRFGAVRLSQSILPDSSQSSFGFRVLSDVTPPSDKDAVCLRFTALLQYQHAELPLVTCCRFDNLSVLAVCF